MNDDLAAAMRRATAAVRDGGPQKATAIIREALGLGGGAGTADASAPPTGRTVTPPPLPPAPREAAIAPRTGRPSVPPVTGGRRSSGPWDLAADPAAQGRRRQPLGAVVDAFKALAKPAAGGGRTEPSAPPPPSAGAQFLARTFTCAAGSRDYRLYVPAASQRPYQGLVVMLHGCKQDPDDFAAGTAMNRVADARGLVIAYPGQTRRANVGACWNWFDPGHQRRDEGEPAIIAGLTAALRDEFRIAGDRVFVAGLSAGGAMAAVMAATYPELYAAAGIHSGLAYGAACDVVSALSAMRRGAPPRSAAATGDARPRLIVFHGTADTTVAPANAESILGVVEDALPAATRSTERIAGSPRRHAQVVHRLDHAGETVAELWIVEGMGHAWAGGTSAGTYTDPAGPDASAEMARFFLRS